jgi:hypothetical protein
MLPVELAAAADGTSTFGMDDPLQLIEATVEVA